MPSAKRERQREGRQARAAAAAAERKRRQRLKSIRNFGLIVAAIVVAVFVLSRQGGDSKQPVAANSSSSSAVAPLVVTVPTTGASLTGDTTCPAADGSSARTTTFAKAPPMCIDATKTYTAVIDTPKGSFTIALDPKEAPNTVNNFVVLARYHFYDGVAFHRVIPGFVDQTGDAVGPNPGQGGPGYTIPDELPTAPNPYPEGEVAMANDSSPNTSGSQWFIVIGSGGSGLTPSYNRLGVITSGLDVAKAINAIGTSGGKPTESVVVTKVTITEN